MTPTASHIVVLTSVMNVTDKNAHQATPIISAHVSRIIGYINGFVLTTLVGVLGVFTNTANICVYVKMGLSETTNISFFAMSISDLLVSLSAAVAQLTYNPPVSEMKLPSGAPLSEIGMAACFIMFPGMGCSAWITAILSLERCLCISTPLRVKEIFTPKRILIIILITVTYQSVFIFVLFLDPGPPYDVAIQTKSHYFISSFSAPSFVCFFVVLVSTTVLVVRLKQNVEWRNEAAKQSNQNSESSKERKAARCVVAVCTIFIICFFPNVVLVVMGLLYPQFTQHDPYMGSLMRILFSVSSMFQVLSSSVNTLVYYKMGTKFREIFNALFCKKRDKKM